MKKYNRLFGYICLVFCFILVLFSLKNLNKNNNASNGRLISNYQEKDQQIRIGCKINKEKYERDCLNLLNDLRNPNPNMFFNPPLDQIPNSMFNDFTQFGEMPLSKLWYFNEPYYDWSSNYSVKKEIITKSEVSYFRTNDGKKRPENNYGDWYNHYYLRKYSKNIRNKTFLVFGSIKPWLEAIALDNQASKVFTFDYNRKTYEENNLMQWWHINDYLDYSLKTKKLENFDNSASYSFIEHLGLGRYGDPLDPNGDIKAVNLIHCLLKENGFLFLGLPSSVDNSSYVYFNAYRVYGNKRLDKLLGDNWEIVEQTNRTQSHSMFILKKKYSYTC